MEKTHIEKNTVQETLVIPLFGRKLCTEQFPDLFQDPKAVELIERIDYDFSPLEAKASGMGYRFGALEVAMRESDLMIEAKAYLAEHPKAALVNLGCGLDQTAENCDNGRCRIYNIDLPDVIAVRNTLLPETDRVKNLAADLNDLSWFDKIDASNGVFFLAAGVFYYFKTEDMTRGERPSREKKPVAFLTESEAQQFLDALQEEPLKWRAYFTLLLMTGMRRGEAVALQWSDIDDGKDTGAPTITISKNAVMDKSQTTGRLIKQTKTGEIRTVPISEATLQMLQELKQETERNMEVTLKPSAFVFCDEANPYLCMYPTSPTRRMEVIVKRHGLKKCSVHELRRTFATLALQAKVDPKTVAAITGHADTATLFKYYTGTDAEQKRKAVAGLEAALKNEKNE